MNLKRRALLGFLAASAWLGVSSASAAAPKCAKPPKPTYVLKLGTAFATGHILVDAAEKFKELVEADTKGGIEIQITTAADTEDNVNVQTSQGVWDIQATGGPPLQVFAPEYFFFNGPYVIKDYAHFLRVWNGPLGDEAKDLVEANGNMVALGTVYRGFRQMTSNVPIAGTADLVGLRLRLPNVPTWVSVWSSLETVPTIVALGALHDALRDGLVDASEGDLSQISSLKLYEVQSNLTLTNHLVGVGWMFINQASLERLPRGYQHKLQKAMKQATEFATQKMIDSESALLVSLADSGMTVGVPDADAIREKARPAVDALFATQWPVTTWAEVLAQ
ncbi:MAG TPA: TRAP transporter substrate-binding protein [Polyangiaceae bacterium]|nr:TRAP transporter substrate-binding protein [Polyangiaceae bacterium]